MTSLTVSVPGGTFIPLPGAVVGMNKFLCDLPLPRWSYFFLAYLSLIFV